MYTEASFKAELSGILPPKYNNNAHKDICWKIYKNASDPTHDRLVAGVLGDLDYAIAKLGPTNRFRKGSVLRTSDWSIFLNDAWILGGIHGHINFELISTPSDETLMNKKFKKGEPLDWIFRVTGRELIGLTSFGYAQVCGPVELVSTEIRPRPFSGCNALIQCVNPALSDSATFTDYQKVIEAKASLAVSKGWKVIDGLMM